MKTSGTIERERSEGSLEARTKSETPSESSVVSLSDYKKKKQIQQEVKQVFKQSLDNAQVLKQYKINQPTMEQRAERIKESIERINKLMEQIKEANK